MSLQDFILKQSRGPVPGGPRELGAIAACTSEISGATITNPYPEETSSHRLFDQGYWGEIAQLKAEKESEEQDEQES